MMVNDNMDKTLCMEFKMLLPMDYLHHLQLQLKLEQNTRFSTLQNKMIELIYDQRISFEAIIMRGSKYCKSNVHPEL